MKKIIVILIMFSLQFPIPVYSQDPANKAECISMLRPALQVQCTSLFGDDNPDLRKTCLENIDEETEKQCERFFSGGNFCSTCTSECIKQFKETDPTRVECLETCFKNPACKGSI